MTKWKFIQTLVNKLYHSSRLDPKELADSGNELIYVEMIRGLDDRENLFIIEWNEVMIHF